MKKNNDVYINSCVPSFLLHTQINIFTRKMYIESDLIDLVDEHGDRIKNTLYYKIKKQSINWADFKMLFLHKIIKLYIKIFCKIPKNEKNN